MTMVFSYTVPGHILGPNPKGSWEKGWGGVVFSLLHRSGMKRSIEGTVLGVDPSWSGAWLLESVWVGRGKCGMGGVEERKEEGNTEYVNV